MNTYEIKTDDNTVLTFTSMKELETVAIAKLDGEWEVVSKTETKTWGNSWYAWQARVNEKFYGLDAEFYRPRKVTSIYSLEQELLDAVAKLASTNSPAHKLDYIATIARINYQMSRELEARLR